MPHFSLPIIRRHRRHAGFTLVELVIVMAITSLLATIAFIGQHQLQLRSRFDSSVDKIVQAAAVARSTALSNVNSTGNGNDTTSVLAGTSLELHNHHIGLGRPLAEMSPVYANQDNQGQIVMSSLAEKPAAGIGVCPAAQHPDDAASECYEQYFQTDDTVTLSDVGISLVYLVYINTDHGLQMCFKASGGSPSISAACTLPPTSPQQFHVKDPNGLTATLEFDPVSGYVRRIN